MLIDEIQANKKLALPPMDAYFEVTSPFRALPEVGWQEWVCRLLDTTPVRPPYDHSWWEVSPGDATRIRYGMRVNYCPIDYAERFVRSWTPSRFVGNVDESFVPMYAAGASSILLCTWVGKIDRRFVPLFYIYQALDARDYAIRSGEGYLIAGQPLSDFAIAMNKEDPEWMLRGAWQLAYFIALTHVRNVGTEEHVPDATIQRARVRRGRPPFVTYKTLHITPMGGQSVKSGNGPVQGIMPIHLVRGNFAHYTEDAPLFGRYTGTYWRPAHVRGNPERGAVLKDYEMHTPKEVPNHG